LPAPTEKIRRQACQRDGYAPPQARGGKEKPVKARVKKIEASAPKRKAKGSPSGSSKRRCSRSRGCLMPGHRRPRLRDVGCVQCRPVQVVSEPGKGRGHVRGISCRAKWMIVRPRGSYMCGSDWCKYLPTEPLHVPGQRRYERKKARRCVVYLSSSKKYMWSSLMPSEKARCIAKIDFFMLVISGHWLYRPCHF